MPHVRILDNCVKQLKLFFFLGIVDEPFLDANYPQDHSVVEGDNLTLQCRVTAANPVPNVTWYRVNKKLDTVHSYGVNASFVNISRTYGGKYYCVARNGIGKAAVSRFSFVNVLCKSSLLKSCYTTFFPSSHLYNQFKYCNRLIPFLLSF